jgi:predicted O-methyltransferase YrrM
LLPFEGSSEFADGWFWPYEGEWYRKLCQPISNGNIIEIGSFEGLSLSYIKDLIALNNNTIYSVDNFIKKRLVVNTKAWGIKLIRKSSVDASLDFEDEFFDLIYIDADHKYKSVKEDIQSWYPKLKFGGIIAGHDYDDELLPNRTVKDRNWFVKKFKKVKLI